MQPNRVAATREAPAQVRAFARRVRDLYVALLQEGFSSDEAEQMLRIPIVMHLNEVKISNDES